MKKNFFTLINASLLIALSLLFASCAKKARPDNYGIYSDLDSALSAAKKSDKKVLLFFTRIDQGGLNETLLNDVLHASDYQKKVGDEFESCVIDFSGERFKKDSASFDKDANEHDMKTALLYGADSTPALLVLSKEGYVGASITYLPAKSVDEFTEILEIDRGNIDALDALLTELDSAKGLSRIQKIDELYEKTSTKFRYQLRGLAEEVIKSDKKNESGLVGKYLLARASTKAMDCYINREPEKAVEAYLEPLDSEFLSTEDKQRSYFAAAYVTGNGMPTAATSEKIIGYLDAAIALAPDTPLAERCKQLRSRQEMFLNNQKATEEKKAAESAIDDTESGTGTEE